MCVKGKKINGSPIISIGNGWKGLRHPHQNNILTMIDRLLEFKWAFTSKY
jgi:hypothetical protein